MSKCESWPQCDAMCCTVVPFTEEEKRAVAQPDKFIKTEEGWYSKSQVFKRNRKWVETRCVFLDIFRECSIYDLRPKVCREHDCASNNV